MGFLFLQNTTHRVIHNTVGDGGGVGWVDGGGRNTTIKLNQNITFINFQTKNKEINFSSSNKDRPRGFGPLEIVVLYVARQVQFVFLVEAFIILFISYTMYISTNTRVKVIS